MAITVTATASGTGSKNGITLTVKVVTSAAAAGSQPGTVNDSATITTPQLAITPAGSSNWVYGALSENLAGTFTANAATTFSANNTDATNAQKRGTFRTTSTTTGGTPVTVGATLPTTTSGDAAIALAEIKNSGTLAEDASSPASANTNAAKTITTASFTPPSAALLVAVISANYSGSGTVSMAVSDTSGLTWTALEQIGTAGYGGVWVAQFPATQTAATTPTFTATATAAATRVRNGAASPSFTATVTAAATVITGAVTIDATQTATAAITAAATRVRNGAATRSATVTITASMTQVHVASAARAVTATVTAAMTQVHVASATRSASASITAAAIKPSSITVINTWTANRAIVSGFSLNAPPSGSLDCPVASTTGNWLIAFCSWTLPAGYLGGTMAVSDDVHGYWIPLGAPSGDSSASGFTRCSIWARPAGASVPGAGHVYVSPCGLPNPTYPAVIGVTVIEITGMSDYAGTPVVVNNYANAATAIAANAPGLGAAAFLATVAASDASTFSTGPGGSWTALTAVSVSGTAPAILHTSPAWQVASTSETASWTTGTTGDLSACTAAILVVNAGPAQPDASWPATQLQMGFGSGALTPPSQITWTDITNRWLGSTETSAKRGKQYELDQLQAGEITLTLDNNDAALTPENDASPFAPFVLADVPVRLLMTWDGRTYSVFSGYVERWPQAWDSVWYGITQITVVDVWSLQTAELAAVQQEEILLDQPYAYWTCGDAAGSTAAQNSAPGNSNSLQVVESKSGALTATFTFGDNSGLDPGDPGGTVYTQTGLTAGDATGYGYCLQCIDQSYPSIANGITIMGWFAPDSPTVQIPHQLILMRGTNAGVGPMFQMYLNSPTSGSPGGLQIAVYDQSTRARTDTVVNSQNWLSGGLSHFALLLTQSTWQVVVDGGAFTGASGSCNMPSSMTWIDFMGNADRYFTGSMINGACCHLAIFPRLLTEDRLAAIVGAGFPVANNGQFGSEHPDLRIERLAGYGGWTGARSISHKSTTGMAGISDIQGSEGSISANGVVSASQGQTAAEAITNIVVSDNGFMGVDGNGVLCYLSRSDLYGNTPIWFLGEDVLSGETPYETDIVFGYDKSLLYNDVELTQSTGSGTAVVAFNAPSAAQHGQYTYSATVYQQDPDTVVDEANWIANTRGTVFNRAENVRVTADANPVNWPFVLGVEPAQIVQVTRRPLSASATTQIQAIITQVTKKIDRVAGTAEVAIETDSFPEGAVLIADDPVFGQLNGSNSLPW